MAKEIQLSDDSGSTWHTLPGSTGSFNADAEAISDTILGQTFQSNEIGLVNWTIGADAIFKGFAGYSAKLLQTGTATATTGEAMSQESGQIYSIDDSSKELWDRTATLTVYDGASDETANVEWVDYLFGRIKFDDAYTVTGAVTIDVSYFGTSVIGRGNSYTLTMNADTNDESDFETVQSNGGYRVFSPGLRSVSLEIGGIFKADTGALSTLTSRDEIMCEIDPAGDGSSIARGFFKFSTTGQSGDVGALEEETLNLELTVPDEALLRHVFNWRHAAGTTLNQATQIMIDAWLDETTDTQARYLPSGATGQSPLDGKSGTVIFTDISLAGGLSDMNVFSGEMQGSGAVTEV